MESLEKTPPGDTFCSGQEIVGFTGYSAQNNFAIPSKDHYPPQRGQEK